VKDVPYLRAVKTLAARQGVLDLELDTGPSGGPLPITSSRMACSLVPAREAIPVVDDRGLWPGLPLVVAAAQRSAFRIPFRD